MHNFYDKTSWSVKINDEILLPYINFKGLNIAKVKFRRSNFFLK